MPDPASYTVGWICALTTELTAAKVFLDEKHDKNDLDPAPENDDNSYEIGWIGKHNVVIAVLPQYGLTNAATVAKDMTRSFPNIRIGLMVGIAGGAPSRSHDIRLGDVVVSARGDGHAGVIQYDFGRALEGDDQFQRTGALNQPPQALLIAQRSLASQYELEGNDLEGSVETVLTKFPRLRKSYAKPDPESDRLFRPDFLHPDGAGDCSVSCDGATNNLVARSPRGEDEDDTVVHYGLIASANTVMKNAQLRDKLVAEEGVLCFEMEAAGLMNQFPCLVIRGICDYCDSHKQKTWQGYSAMTAAAYAKDLLLHISPKQVEREQPVREVLGSLEKSMNSLKIGLDETNAATKAIHQDLDLVKLPIASGASFDSHAEEQQARCLPETRVELLDHIADWAASTTSKPVFWLNGMAGTGKSTIARTVAQSFSRCGKLGATFFFKKGDSDRGKAAKFFTTIAAELLRVETALEPAVRSALRADPAISERSLGEQFEKLILQPLLATEKDHSRSSSRVIVIDALDECEKEKSAEIILKLLIQAGAALKFNPLRIFITSRPDFHIRLGFKEMPDGTHQDFVLHQIPRNIVERDIRLFIEHELSSIRKQREIEATWPAEEQNATLVQLATPLFIVAATMCRYIGTKGANPISKLNKIVLCGKSTLDQTDQLYFTLLDELLTEQDIRDRIDWLDDFQSVVGPIVLLMQPLSIPELSCLLGRQMSDVRLQLDALHSLLRIPEEQDTPVQILHLSFREFLFDSEKKNQHPFWMEESKIHEKLASDCLRIMSSHLCRDICGLGDPASHMDDISRENVATHLPAELQYACRYWIDHLVQSRQLVEDDGDVHRFLQRHLLHWLEAMVLIREYSDCVGLITRLQSNTSFSAGPLSEFLYDAKRFMLRFRFVIVDTPLQLYSSALLFAPEGSLIRRTFGDEELGTDVSILTRSREKWDPCLITLEGHSALSGGTSHSVWGVTFSPDGQFIASKCSDCTVRLWDTVTGVCLTVLNFSPVWAWSMVFSPDGGLLAMTLNDGTLRLWDMETETFRTSLDGFSHTVKVIGFSSDQKLFAAAYMEYTVHVLETTTWTRWSTLDHTDLSRSAEITFLAFSPYDIVMATASFYDKFVWLWAVPPEGTATYLRRLEGHSDNISSFVFSPSIKTLLASNARDGTTRLWNTDGSCISIISHDKCEPISNIALSGNHVMAFGSKTSMHLWDLSFDSRVPTVRNRAEVDGNIMDFQNDIAFSPDGNLLASGGHDSTVRLWDVQQAKAQRTSETYSSDVHGIVFSPDGMLVASWPHNHAVQLWNTETGTYHTTIEGHSEGVATVAFRPDGQQLAASSSRDPTIRLWDLRTFKCHHILHGHLAESNDFSYSPDGKTLASASSDQTVRLWDTRTGQCTRILHDHPRGVGRIAFSPDGTLIVSASHDYGIHLWETREGVCRATFQGPSNFIQHMIFSIDGKLLLTLAGEQIEFWDTSTGSCCGTLSATRPGDTGRPWTNNFAFAPDGLSLYVGWQKIALPPHLRREGAAEERDQDHLTIQQGWILRNGRRLLRIPHELLYQAEAAVWQNKICWGTFHGQVFILKVRCD